MKKALFAFGVLALAGGVASAVGAILMTQKKKNLPPTPQSCETDTDCLTGQKCNVETKQCVNDACSTNADCGEMQICSSIDNRCKNVQCIEDAHCPENKICSSQNRCLICENDGHCPSGTRCIAQDCRLPCSQGSDCPITNTCKTTTEGGWCLNPNCDVHDDCPKGQICSDLKRCIVGCRSSAECTGDSIYCIGGTCKFAECETDDHCPLQGQVCDKFNTCKSACTVDADCDYPLVCKGGTCMRSSGCLVDSDCNSPNCSCKGGACFCHT